jgi:hypothetical protein
LRAHHGPHLGELIYASYLLIQSGYVLRSLSLRNLAVVTLASVCNIARALAGVRPLARSPASVTYRERPGGG